MEFRGLAMVAAGAVLLSACNMVISNEPMLARGPDSPAMKPGIWIDTKEQDCEFDSDTSPETWPECADPAIVSEDGRFFTWEDKNQRWKGVNLVLGTGDPVVVQAELPVELTGANPLAPRFIYLAMRPTATDPGGLITAIKTWAVYCGPVEEKDDKQVTAENFEDAMADSVTRQPFAGLTVVQGNCIARDVAALQNAAGLSETLDRHSEDGVGSARWLRAADDVDFDAVPVAGED